MKSKASLILLIQDKDDLRNRWNLSKFDVLDTGFSHHTLDADPAAHCPKKATEVMDGLFNAQKAPLESYYFEMPNTARAIQVYKD